MKRAGTSTPRPVQSDLCPSLSPLLGPVQFVFGGQRPPLGQEQQLLCLDIPRFVLSHQQPSFSRRQMTLTFVSVRFLQPPSPSVTSCLSLSSFL